MRGRSPCRFLPALPWAVALCGLLWCMTAAAQGAGGSTLPAIEAVEIRGNARTRPAVIHRLLTVRSGDPVDPGQLVLSRRRLEATGFFAASDVYVRPGSRRGLAVVVVEVQEHRWPRYRFEGGHGELDGWFIAPVAFTWDNFAGNGHGLDWRWRIGTQTSRVEAHYRHPYWLRERAVLDVQLFGQTRVLPHYLDGREITPEVHSAGARVRVHGRRGWARPLFVGMRLQHHHPEDEERLQALIPDDFVNSRIVAVSLGLVGDSRDDARFPRRGLWGQFRLEQAAALVGSQRQFTRVTADGRWYGKLDERNVLAVRLQGGMVTADAPFYERFYLGGPYSLRGYECGELTPLGWATRQLLVQGELRFPVGASGETAPGHVVALYYDAGGAWGDHEVPLLADLHHAFGVGYRLRLPVVGVLRVGFSLPTSTVDRHDFRFQLALGQAY